MNGNTKNAIVRRYRVGFRLDKIAEWYTIGVEDVLDVLVEKGALNPRRRNAVRARRGGKRLTYQIVTRRLVQQGNQVRWEITTRQLEATDADSARRQVEDGLKIDSIQEVS